MEAITLFVFILMLVSSLYCFENVVKPSCAIDAEMCEFHWTVDYFQTMTIIPPDGKGKRLPIVPINGSLYVKTNCGSTKYKRKVNEDDKYVTGDGTTKFMFAINDQVPGPSIVVYEGQEIVVHVHNKLLMEGISIHWHGLPQKGSQYMDGVARVTQCPINPGETFTYRFKAVPYGTFWYHSHLGAQRSDGLAGALIILRKQKLMKVEEPNVRSEFLFMVEDWFQRSYIQEIKLAEWNINRFDGDPKEDICADIKRTYDWSLIGQKGRQTPVINGKGRSVHHSEENRYLPLETFVVQRKKHYVFRIIGMAAMSSYRISIDNHLLRVIAVDGADIEPEVAESIIIQSGERYDVEIYTDARIGNYWMRIEDLTVQDTDKNPLPMTKAYGILRYTGADIKDPTSLRKDCTKNDPCRIVNCIFGKFPDSMNTYCSPVSELKATDYMIKTNPVPTPYTEDDIEEFFLNFHYSVKEDDFETVVPAINNLRMSLPAFPPLIEKSNTFPKLQCTPNKNKFAMDCTHVIKLRLGKVVQFVLLNFEPSGFGRPHPIHMHGHRFHVMKIGFPEYDSASGIMSKRNQDIKCKSPKCSQASWADPSWRGGHVDGMNLKNPPLKDTLIIPWGGYAVIRIYTDNPGYWYMHCHIELHNIDGMSLMLQEGEISDMPDLPSDIPVCGYKFRNAKSIANLKTDLLLQQTREKGMSPKVKISDQNASSIIGIAVMSCVVALSIVINIVGAIIMLRRRRKVTLYTCLPENHTKSKTQDKDEYSKLLQ